MSEPFFHSHPHSRASFGFGMSLILISGDKHRQRNPVVEIRNLKPLIVRESAQKSMEEFDKFPGPLGKQFTRKNDVILFVQKRAAIVAKSTNLIDPESHLLLWKLLELLLRQNGVTSVPKIHLLKYPLFLLTSQLIKFDK